MSKAHLQRKALKPVNRSAIGTVDVCPDDNLLVVGQDTGGDGVANLTLWSLDTFEHIDDLETRPFEFISLARFSGDGKSIAYLDTSMEARLYDLEDRRTSDARFDTREVRWFSYARRRDRLLLAGSTTQVWDPHPRRLIWTAPGPERSAEADEPPAVGALDGSGKRAAVAGLQEGCIVVYDLESGKVVQRLDDGPNHARSVLFAPNGKLVAALEWNSRGGHVWNVESGRKLESEVINAEAEGLWSMRFHPGSGHLAIGMLLGWVSLVRLDNDELLLDEQAHEGRVWDVAFSQDGKRLISGGEDAVANVWDIAV